MNYIQRADGLKKFTERIVRQERVLFLAFGDSNACNAHFSGSEKCWGELLHTELRDQLKSQSVLYLNASISGDTVQNGLARWESDIARARPELAIFAMGSNDSGRSTPELFRAGTLEVLKRFRDRGTQVLMRTTAPIMEREPAPPHLWNGDVKLQAINDIIREISDELKLPLVDIYAWWKCLERDGQLEAQAIYRDEAHHNSDGHRLIARCMLPAFGLNPTFVWEREASAHLNKDGTYRGQ